MTGVRLQLPAVWPLTARSEIVERGVEGLSDPSMVGLLVRGTAGSGKSRVGAEIAAALERAGTTVFRIAAGPTLRTMPLGALLALLPVERDAAEAASGIE